MLRRLTGTCIKRNSANYFLFYLFPPVSAFPLSLCRQRPCKRCVAVGKADQCFDVEPKKRACGPCRAAHTACDRCAPASTSSFSFSKS